MADLDYVLKQGWDEVIDYMDDEYAFFLTHILNMGNPRWTEQLPTAAVSLPVDQDGKPVDTDQFEFLYNPNFFSKLQLSGRAFITAHEAMHVILNHLRLAQSSHFDDKMLFNIAADCVINDYLVESGMTLPTQAELDASIMPGAKLMRGTEQVGYNCASRTVTEVYDDLDKQQKQQDGEGEGEGDGDPQSGGGAYQEFDSHDWMHDPQFAQKMADAIDEAFEQVKNDVPGDIDRMRQDINYDSGELDAFRSRAGDGLGPEEQWAKVHGVSLAWTDLLKEIDPDLFRGKGMAPPPVPSYHAPRRKIAGYYPNVMLPIYRKNPNAEDVSDQKPLIAMFLDVSGSISQPDRKKFISLAQTVPQDKIELFVATFTVEVRELDLENPRYNSGGTDFACIQKYIKNTLIKDKRFKGEYPKAVVIVTDGQADFGNYRPTAEEAKSWYWLMTDGISSYYNEWSKIGKNKKLREFTKVGI